MNDFLTSPTINLWSILPTGYMFSIQCITVIKCIAIKRENILFQTLLGDDQYIFTRLNKVFDSMPASPTLSHKLFPRPPTPFAGMFILFLYFCNMSITSFFTISWLLYIIIFSLSPFLGLGDLVILLLFFC